MTDECYTECPFAPRNDTFVKVHRVLEQTILKNVSNHIDDVETAAKLPEYNVMSTIENAMKVNQINRIAPDRRLDEEYLVFDDEPVSNFSYVHD